MQVSATRFLNLLESQQLLSDDIIAELRRQVLESKSKLSPELLAKLLVDNGHLTKFQATKLIAQVAEQAPAKAESRYAEQPEDELGLAEEELDMGTERGDQQVATVFVDDEPVEVEPAEELVEVGSVDVLEVVEPMVVAEASMRAATRSTGAAVGAGIDLGPPASLPTRVAKKPIAKANPWDSFRILGVALLLGFVLIPGYFLLNYFIRGSADEQIERADGEYSKRSYETAASSYLDFTENFPTHEKVSYAKVRNALALLRRDVENAPDPKLGLATAQQVLPPIASESGLAEQQSDLAGALVGLAEKFIERADDRKETEERRELMKDMDQLMTLIGNPQFVGATQRAQQEPTLRRIDEDSKRIKREIDRDDVLAATLVKIDKSLEERDVLKAYAERKELVRSYPLLEANEAIVERLKRATDIQRELVKNSDANWSISDNVPNNEVGRSFVLGSTIGKAAPGMTGRTVFVKVKGSVYGLDGETGRVLWRKFVGRGFEADPIRLGDEAAPDALLVEPELGQLSRIDGQTGSVKWQASLGEPLLPPTLRGADILVSSLSGIVACLRAEDGITNWMKQLPQPVQVSPGTAELKGPLYIPAEHSNMYVLDRGNGNCLEVVYLGHEPGAIRVPPVVLLGQLFVCQNNTSESSRLRIFTAQEGKATNEAQLPIQVDGNVLVPPQVDGRRLILQSDLGHMLALDVEPTVETQKVTTVATVPKNFYQSQLSWPLAENNKVWVADTRFTRFDVQVAGQKFSRAWIKNDGDSFTGPSQKFGNVIIHTRVLRGNRGVRVAAIEADSGEPHWEIDLGVPVMLLTNAGERKYDAINTSGSYFAMDSVQLRSSADANPGQGKPSMLLHEPVWLNDSTAVMLNASNANQMAVYSTTGNKLKLLNANFGSARPSCQPTAVNEKFVVGLNNGQLALIDPTNGTVVGTPYQPTMAPGRDVRWSRPWYQADSKTLFAASDLLKLARLSVGSGLRVLNDIDLEYPLEGSIVGIGKMIGGVVSAPTSDSFRLFNANDLSDAGSLELNGRLVAGPFPTADGCLLQTDTSLVAISNDGSMAWSTEFDGGEVLTQPMVAGSNWLLVTKAGDVLAIDPQSGELSGRDHVGQGLSSAPQVVGSNMLIGSDEGAVLALPIPVSREPQ